jgi:hypothetical protein
MRNSFLSSRSVTASCLDLPSERDSKFSAPWRCVRMAIVFPAMTSFVQRKSTVHIVEKFGASLGSFIAFRKPVIAFRKKKEARFCSSIESFPRRRRT